MMKKLSKEEIISQLKYFELHKIKVHVRTIQKFNYRGLIKFLDENIVVLNEIFEGELPIPINSIFRVDKLKEKDKDDEETRI